MLWANDNDASVPKLFLTLRSTSDEGFIGGTAVDSIEAVVWK